MLGLGGLFRAAPAILLTLLGGAVADRLPRKRVLMLAQPTMALTSLVLGWLVWSGRVEAWQIYLFNAANGSLQAFDGPARQALFPSLVKREQIQAAVTLNSVLLRFAGLVGPAVAGLLIANVSLAAPYFANSISYLALIAALAAIRLPAQEPTRGRALRADLAQGLRYVHANRVLFMVVVLEAISSHFGHNTALITIVARDVLNVGPQGLGLLPSSLAGGAIAGTLVLVAVGTIQRKGRLLLTAGLAYAALLVAFSLSRGLWLAAFLLMALGMADSVCTAWRSTIAQLATTDEMRGRVMSVVITVSRGLTQASQVQTGLLIGWLGAPAAVIVGSTLISVSLVGAMIRAPALSRFTGEAPATRLGAAIP